MNARNRKVPTRFGPETRFEVRPGPAAPFREVQENHFEQLKTALVQRRLEGLWNPELSVQVRRAAHEAAALAWITPYPLLVFPTLFEEKAAAALRVANRQRQIRSLSRELFAV